VHASSLLLSSSTLNRRPPPWSVVSTATPLFEPWLNVPPPISACHPPGPAAGFVVGAPSVSCVRRSAHSASKSCCTVPALGSAASSVTAQ